IIDDKSQALKKEIDELQEHFTKLIKKEGDLQTRKQTAIEAGNLEEEKVILELEAAIDDNKELIEGLNQALSNLSASATLSRRDSLLVNPVYSQQSGQAIGNNGVISQTQLDYQKQLKEQLTEINQR